MVWTDAWSLGASLWNNTLAVCETALSSNNVIQHRRSVIKAAIHNPESADLAELNRMWTEKLAAFSAAGASLMTESLQLQNDCVKYAAEVISLYGSGTVPSAEAMGPLQRKATRILANASLAGGRALAPVHRTATANEMRLRKSRRQK